MNHHLAVLDSSVGVKWYRPESGSEEAMGLLLDHGRGDLHIVVASHFLHEVLNVARREWGSARTLDAWELLRGARLSVAHLDDELVEAAASQCRVLGCTFYDALAPALAALLDAPLYSADRRAHGAFPGVSIVGG